MLGWDVFVYRQVVRPSQDPERVLLARWMTGVFGLSWLDDLVKANKAIDLGGDGYPCRYSVAAGELRSAISDGLPANKSPLVIGEDDVLPPGWNGELIVDQAKLADCPSEEQLALEAWDQS